MPAPSLRRVVCSFPPQSGALSVQSPASASASVAKPASGNSILPASPVSASTVTAEEGASSHRSACGRASSSAAPGRVSQAATAFWPDFS